MSGKTMAVVALSAAAVIAAAVGAVMVTGNRENEARARAEAAASEEAKADAERKTAAAQVYARMIREKQGGAGPLIAMAKICEHRKRDIPAAIEYTRRAVVLAADQPNADMAALQKRYQRRMLKARRNG